MNKEDLRLNSVAIKTEKSSNINRNTKIPGHMPCCGIVENFMNKSTNLRR